ncbi:conjugal transfer protein, partial [Streptomyces cellulosae]
DGRPTELVLDRAKAMRTLVEDVLEVARLDGVHTDGRDAENERRTADLVQALAYHRARAASHPSDRIKKWSERKSWRLARKVGVGDVALGSRLLDVQRDRVTAGADAALASMFGGATPTPALDPAHSAKAEESTKSIMKRSTAELRESTPEPVVTLTRLTVPEPVAVDLGKSIPPLKPVPAIPAPIEPPATKPVRGAVAAESTPRRRATGRLPDVARSPRPKRTPEELLAEARSATADWPDAKVTAEGIRRAIHTSPANARTLRDTILAERAA